jgi:Ala-tRNA(Pro) deacylase
MIYLDASMAMLALPANLRVNLTKAAEALGSREVRLAHEDEFQAAFPDCDVGAMPPFGNLYRLKTYVDESLSDEETIVFNAGTHEDTVHMKYADFERLVQPARASFAS